MSQAFDLSQFPDLSPEAIKAFAAVQFDLSAAPREPRNARALPENLPRVERVIEPGSIVWSPLERHWSERQWRRGCGDMVRIGEYQTEPFDVIPARYQVIVTVRPKYACPPIG